MLFLEDLRKTPSETKRYFIRLKILVSLLDLIEFIMDQSYFTTTRRKFHKKPKSPSLSNYVFSLLFLINYSYHHILYICKQQIPTLFLFFFILTFNCIQKLSSFNIKYTNKIFSFYLI